MQASKCTFLEGQQSKSLGSISRPLRKYDEFLALRPGPESHVIDVLVTRLTLPASQDNHHLSSLEVRGRIRTC